MGHNTSIDLFSIHRLPITTSSSSASTSTPPETTQNGLMRPDGPATPAKDRQPQTSSQNASTKQNRTSQADASEQTTLTPTPTGKKTSTSSSTPSAPQSSPKTSSWTILQTLSIYKAELESMQLWTLMWKGLWSGWRVGFSISKQLGRYLIIVFIYDRYHPKCYSQFPIYLTGFCIPLKYSDKSIPKYGLSRISSPSN